MNVCKCLVGENNSFIIVNFEFPRKWIFKQNIWNFALYLTNIELLQHKAYEHSLKSWDIFTWSVSSSITSTWMIKSLDWQFDRFGIVLLWALLYCIGHF